MESLARVSEMWSFTITRAPMMCASTTSGDDAGTKWKWTICGRAARSATNRSRPAA
jgi:hypothetical protein